MSRRFARWIPVMALGFAGCAGSGSGGDDPLRGVREAEAYSAEQQGRSIGPTVGPPPATVDGEPVEWAELQSRLGEAAGGAVVDEIALERLLTAEMARRGLSIGEQAVRAERGLLMETVAAQAGANTEQLITQLRERRGLGPIRFEALLRRNAMLRALVRDRVEVSTDQVELAWRVRHGERVRLRIIVVASEREAQSARAEALAGDPAQLESRFIALAQERSTDASGARGGLVEPFSTADPAYESAIRSAAEGLRPGEVGPVVAISNGFAVVYLDERVPADGVSLASATPALREQLRIRQERLLMDELATQLLAEARITTFDDSLTWSRRAAESR